MFYLTMHSTHLIYGYMASDIIMVKDHSDSERGNLPRHMCYFFRLAASVLLYASSHRRDSTYHDLCYTSRGNNIKPFKTITHAMQCFTAHTCEVRKALFYLTTPSTYNLRIIRAETSCCHFVCYCCIISKGYFTCIIPQTG